MIVYKWLSKALKKSNITKASDNERFIFTNLW